MFANTFLLVHKHATALFLSQLIVYEHLYSLALYELISNAIFHSPIIINYVILICLSILFLKEFFDIS